jgi:carbon starvation protein
VIVLTVVQLVFRVMRVTLTEWVGQTWAGFRNQTFATLLSMVAALFLVLTGTWVYLWQMFGASNQLMAALSLLVVTIWLASTRRNPAFAGIPMLFMYVTTLAATAVTGYNLYATIVVRSGAQAIEVVGAVVMILIAILLLVASVVIGMDGLRAWNRFRTEAAPEVEAVPT